MTTAHQREQWDQDNEVLAQIGVQLQQQSTTVIVRLPHKLAAAATAAWQRDDWPDDDAAMDPPPEVTSDRAVRHRAGSLALIGLAIESRGEFHEDYVEVELASWFVGHALDTADDAGLL